MKTTWFNKSGKKNMFCELKAISKCVVCKPGGWAYWNDATGSFHSLNNVDRVFTSQMKRSQGLFLVLETWKHVFCCWKSHLFIFLSLSLYLRVTHIQANWCPWRRGSDHIKWKVWLDTMKHCLCSEHIQAHPSILCLHGWKITYALQLGQK